MTNAQREAQAELDAEMAMDRSVEAMEEAEGVYFDLTPNYPVLFANFTGEAERTATALLKALPPFLWGDVHQLLTYLALAANSVTKGEDVGTLAETMERIAETFVVECTAPVEPFRIWQR